MKKLFTTLALVVVSLTTMAQAPAFPGAEGHGRYVTGGRGGEVRHVTNLNNSGAGSFRNAVSGDSKKIVVFDVGGVIALESDVNIGANTTILGQTAPAPGITLRYYTLKPQGNVIIRFIRSRRGQEKNVNDGADAITGQHHTGMIFDHCSFSWSIDEVASFYDNNNFTMQWCTIGESLNNAGHGKGAHGYGGIWGGKLASFHHNLICHVSNRSPRFNGARYNWNGYTGNKLYNQYKWANTLQAEMVDFRNCVVYNCGNGCYGGPGGGLVNMVNNYYKTGPAGTTNRVTTVSLADSDNGGSDQTFWDMTSRYYIVGNTFANQNGSINNTPTTNNWGAVNYDNGVVSHNGERWTKDPHHYYGENLTYTKINNVDCLPIKLTEPAPTGDITTHSALNAYEKVLTYSGVSLNPDDVDQRYFTEARNGTATYKGSVTKKAGRIDLVSDVNGYTEANFGTGSRATDFDADNDGIADAWEQANGGNLNPNGYDIDPAKYYTNIEVYANSLVQDIMLSGNADAEEATKEYYPRYTKEDGTVVEAINTLGVNLDGSQGGDTPTQESKSYTVSFNGKDIESSEGFFSYGDGKHNFNSKFTGTYDGMEFASGLKMEGTTMVEFTTNTTATVTIVQSTWSDYTLKFDGAELDVTSATTPANSSGVRVYTIAGISADNHKITRGSGESGIFYVEVKTDGTTSITKAPKIISTLNHQQYNLAGQKVNSNYRGFIVENGQKRIRL